MPRRKTTRRGAAGCVAQTRSPGRRPARSTPTTPEPREEPAQRRAPNRPEWADPLNEEELRALEAGWGFVE
ncbi:hypothetical protein BGCPKDLD_0880 [Methylorubrum suomiense]|uniref:Uncharacterized protein n=1 Tax=Methylorubrum suomiense TaxID=144191 RepID=A0ABQ4UPQ5_9HYPH|nr:hypothetical protein BGCPKDLD_0880 [Methylorubrum suomiense]